MDVQPYKVQVSDDTLADLRERLAHTRWSDEIPGSEWDYGTNLAYLKELVNYWQKGFDWRAQEKRINSFAHFRSKVDGLGIHFVQERGKGRSPMPLVITHGWPGSFFEMYKIIPLLTDPGSHGGDPADSFDVVAPSMPGYGFSDHTSERGMHVLKISDLWAKLMTEGLSYERFGAQGGDWGASVTAYLGLAYPQHLIGIHVTSMVRPTPYLGPGAQELTEAEKGHLKQREDWLAAEGGYSHIQGTKPQTLAYGLNDSPAGLAAWINESARRVHRRIYVAAFASSNQGVPAAGAKADYPDFPVGMGLALKKHCGRVQVTHCAGVGRSKHLLNHLIHVVRVRSPFSGIQLRRYCQVTQSSKAAGNIFNMLH